MDTDSIPKCVDTEILNAVFNSASHREVMKNVENGESYRSSYSYITDGKFKPLAILNLPYLENDDFINKKLSDFLTRLGLTYLFILVLAILLAYLLSKYITKSLKTISEKMNAIRLEKRNEKLDIGV